MSKISLKQAAEKKQEAILCGGEIDVDKTSELINWIYDYCDLQTKPNLRVFYSIDEMIRFMKKYYDKLKNPLKSNVGFKIYSRLEKDILFYLDENKNVGEGYTENILVKNISWCVEKQINSENIWNRNIMRCISVNDYIYAAILDHLIGEGIVKGENYNKIKEFLELPAVISYAFNNDYIILTMPVRIQKRDDGKLHCVDAPALEWFDGSGIYCLDGAWFKEKEFDAIVGKEIERSWIHCLFYGNATKRAIALKNLGFGEGLLNIVGDNNYRIDLISSEKINGEIYEVIEIDMGDDLVLNAHEQVVSRIPARFVRVVCSTTKQEYYLRVDPLDANTRTPSGAIAWTFGIDKKDYKPIKET